MAEVLVRDETMAGREIGSRVLPGLPHEITARELVRWWVRSDAARPGTGRVDSEAQADVACASFARNGFVMIVGERQVEDLDEVIDLRRTPSVSFIRLVPLVGG